MKSFSIIRTNVGLTTNVKVICDSNYNLYLESIDSEPELSINRLKKFQFNKDNFYDELVPYFFKDVPVDVAFSIYNPDDRSNMSSDFSNQYEDIYQMGARNIIDNKNYKEEYEYFAPLYVFKKSFPKYFIIFRIDGPGLEELNQDNFRVNFLKKFKTVKLFDLTKKSLIGEWIDRNFINNRSFPSASLEVDFRNLEFSRWYGIDYDSGGFTYKSSFLDNSLENENTLFDFEKLFFEGYKTNRIIHPQILNFSFLFDDTPATPTSIRKWSLNRYSGFYLEDIEMIDCFTPFILPRLKSDVSILNGNILYSPSGDPFVLGFKDDKDMWIEYNGDFYKVEKFTETSSVPQLSASISKNPPKKLLNEKVSKTEISKNFTQETVKREEYRTLTTTKYRIISDLDLEDKQNDLNQKTCYIDSNNHIIKLDGSTYSISNFENADVNIIEIDGVYHNLILENGYLKVNSDYGFNYMSEYRLEYYISAPDPNYYKYVDLVITNQNSPKCFKIYKLKFTDIRDFDNQIVDNEFSKFEYELLDQLTETEEIKMYTTDLRSSSSPASFNDYIYKNEVVNLPCSSDYTANLETFRIVDGELSELWSKNAISCRFGYQNSLSSNDYPYLLNNNDIHENFNRTVDTNNSIPNRRSRNLDYFYTINSGTNSYIHHSLHIERNFNDYQDPLFFFEIDKYLNISTYSLSATESATYSFDYFSYLFSGTQSFFRNQIIKKSNKYSYFEEGDSALPNLTLFRGLKFKLYEIESIKKNDISVENINAFSSNKFQDYKFSILLSSNLYNIDNDGVLYKPYYWNTFTNLIAHPSGYLAIETGNATFSSLNIGDIIDITTYNKNSYIDGQSSITYVGSIGSGKYGFITNKSFTQSATCSGIYTNNFIWQVIKNWEHNTQYYAGDKVLYEEVLYNVTSDNIIDDPNQDPSNLTSYYSFTNLNVPFWNPDYNYSSGDWCYNQGEFHVRNDVSSSQGIDFWTNNKPYGNSDVVKWKNKYYKLQKQTTSIKEKPEENNIKNDITSSKKLWQEIPDPKTWQVYEESFGDFEDMWDNVPVWDDNEYYFEGDYVVYDQTLYRYTSDVQELGITPPKNSICERIYSFELETDFVYTALNNSIIQISDSYYYCKYNRLNTTESGINIFINEKYKNVLVNIYVNDNTTFDISNSTRDNLYVDYNSRLTAANFIRQINDLDSKYDFSDYTTYIIVDESGNISKYNFDNNIESLPYMIICEEPDEFEVNNDTLNYKVNTPTRTELKPLKFLVDGTVDNLEKINYYNEIPLGCEIDRNFNSDKPFGVNYNGRSNITVSKNASVKPKSNANISETFFRHSGYYMPIFYEIQLFKAPGEYESELGNYKFDENITDFGIVKQRIISKINRRGNILKLRNSDNLKSIYPMLDEFGYMVLDFFIFKSTWDLEYHIEVTQPNTTIITTPIKKKIIGIDRFVNKNNLAKK